MNSKRGGYKMANHQASKQMLGYLYQVRYALLILLENDNSEAQISIEKFDDVAFSEADIPKQLLQLKHHISRQASLTDGSTDLWRTLKVWIDKISESPNVLNDTDFLIVTTAIAPEGTAASCLKRCNNRNEDEAYEKLMNVCLNLENKENQKYYAAFLSTDEAIIKRLIKNIFVIDGASNIIDIEMDIRKQLRYSCKYKYEDLMLERLEGWWFEKAIEALCSDIPKFITQRDVRSFIVSTSQQYADDNLPIDFFDIGNIQENDLSNNEKIFCEQLKLLQFGSHRIQTAVRDYYRAFKQRGNWVRNDLLYINELEEYENRLFYEWDYAFAAMEDDLDGYSKVTENEKITEGRRLFSEIQNKDIRIRPKCQEPFVMRGSYHMLANQLKVGWHKDFYERLIKLLDICEEGDENEKLECANT